MPWAVAAAGVAAGGSVYGASQQAGAVNSSSKAAQRALEESYIRTANINKDLVPRLEKGGELARTALTGANESAAADLNRTYGTASTQITDAGKLATGYLDKGRETIGTGVTNANALLQPYIDQGTSALKLTGDLSGANGVEAGKAAMENFQFSPGYQFALDQGLKAVDAGAAARGMLVSGGTRAAEMKYGQGLASQDFASYYNRLSGLAGQGLQASNAAGNNIMTGAAGQSGIDRTQGQNALSQGAAQAAISTGLGSQLSGNSMTTGGRMADNEQRTAAQLSNMFMQQASNNTVTAGQQAQTAASTGTALAGIYGNQVSGVTSAINSGLNNYMYYNSLSPQAQQQPPPVQAPQYGGLY